MGKQKTSLDKQRAVRLGAVLKKQRERQELSAYAISKAAGLSRSYISYMEAGRFAEMGLDKFARVVEALGVSADQILQEAGYLPQTDHKRPDPSVALRETYNLSGARLAQALKFAEFLAAEAPQAPPRSKRK